MKKGLYRIAGCDGIWRVWSRSTHPGFYYLHPWNQEARDYQTMTGGTAGQWIEAFSNRILPLNLRNPK